MHKPTKILIIGMISAFIVFSASKVNTHLLESKVKKLEAQCIDEDIARKTRKKGGRWIMICDAKSLFTSENSLKGIQASIRSAQKEVNNSKRKTPFLSIIILGLSVLPWLWYFLLKRVRELSKAVIGK